MRKIVKALIPSTLFARIEPFGHLLEAVLWNVVYGFPAYGMKVIGVTGTDGKTTTTTMIWRMLKEAGYKVAYQTTIGYGTPEYEEANYIHMTTVSSRDLLKRIRKMRREGIDWLVLETTSHALAQNRIWGVPYSVAVMTNVGHEHLDYHKTFESYRDAKAKLFSLVGGNRRGLGVGIINADDPSADVFAAAGAAPITYGIEKGEVRATDIKTSATGSIYTVRHKESTLNIAVNIPGRFNVSNSLAAACVGGALGLTDVQIEQGIAATTNVEGRMTTVDEGQGFGVIVDFAHTPNSFEKLLGDMSSQIKKPGRLIVMFGSAGRRDETKRAVQGRLAGKYADLVVVTEEDDRDIDGQMIMDQIAGGAEESGKKRDKDLFLVHNRIEAIAFALGKAKKGDTVMLLGKGHEKTIERADGEHPWDEVGEVRKALLALAPVKKPAAIKKAPAKIKPAKKVVAAKATSAKKTVVKKPRKKSTPNK